MAGLFFKIISKDKERMYKLVYLLKWVKRLKNKIYPFLLLWIFCYKQNKTTLMNLCKKVILDG